MIGIIGAGPGGLTAAVALRRVGEAVEVLERAPTVRPVGAGLTLQRNALRMLAAVGLDEAVAAAGRVLTQGGVARADGTPLTEVLDRDHAGVAIHRGALSRILVEALGDGVVKVDARVDVVHADGRVRFADGGERTYDAVIGADGIHSAVRTSLFGPCTLRYSGTTCWRGVAAYEGGTTLVERWGRGLRFGTVPIGPDLTYWFACATAPAGQADGDDPIAELTDRFDGFEPVVAEVLRATPTVMRHDLMDLPPLPRWTEGVVTLLGDAAHAMTPNLGQGAAQAIEDAVALASAVARSERVDDALRVYERDRRPRANRFVERSWRLGKVAQWSSPLACFVRDQLMAITPRRVVRRSLRSGFEVAVPTLAVGGDSPV